MNKIEKLIKELCPNGVEWKKLGEVCDIVSGKDYKHFEFYNFAANTLRIEEGELKTEKGNYSETPQAATTTPSTTTPSTSTGSNSSSGDYDDVPKTGDIRFNPLWLVLAAGICFIGAYRLKKN